MAKRYLYRYDDEIFDHMMKEFPELAEAPYDKLVKIDEEWMKSVEGKKRWREFIERCVGVVTWLVKSCPWFRSALRTGWNWGRLTDIVLDLIFDSYKEKVKDYNFGSLIRTDAMDEYGEANTIFGAFLVLHSRILYTNVLFHFLVTRIQVR